MRKTPALKAGYIRHHTKQVTHNKINHDENYNEIILPLVAGFMRPACFGFL